MGWLREYDGEEKKGSLPRLIFAQERPDVPEGAFDPEVVFRETAVIAV